MNAFILAAVVRLAWMATSPTVDAGYRVKWGFTQGGPYNHVVEAGTSLNATIEEPWPLGSTVYFTAYAYNSSGLESGPSNEVSWLVPIPTPTPAPEPSPPSPPSNLQFLEAIVRWFREFFGGT
jgi:hypothetical protein